MADGNPIVSGNAIAKILAVVLLAGYCAIPFAILPRFCLPEEVDPIPENMMGAAVIFASFTPEGLFASPFMACALVTVPANALIRSLSTEHAEADRMPAFLAPEDWATWLGENGNDLAAAKAACRTVEGVRWKMTKEERAKSQKRAKPTASDPGGLL